MRWIVFIVAACLAVALDMGLSGAMTLRTIGFITPSFAGCLVAWIALFGRPDCVLWGAWVLGLLCDLTPGSMEGQGLVFIIGPHALGTVCSESWPKSYPSVASQSPDGYW